jgi:hypothetical protein
MSQLFAFRVTFRPAPQRPAQSWTRFYESQAQAETDAPRVVRKEYSRAVVLSVERVSDPRGPR